MNVSIEDKGNTKFKITITDNDDVRIKLQAGCDDKTRMLFVCRLKHVAQEAIAQGLNSKTLRGKCGVNEKSIVLYTDSKKVVQRFNF
jgi:hypothetical protein